MRNVMLVLVIVVAVPLSMSANGAITVPAGFTVDILLDQIDGETPRLEAISNPDYGFGVVAASADEGILTVLRISQFSVQVLGTLSGFTSDCRAGSIRFDRTGLFMNELYVIVMDYPFGGGDPPYIYHYNRSQILSVSANGMITNKGSYGSNIDRIMFIHDFTDGNGGYYPGMHLEDQQGYDGTSFYYLDPNFVPTKLGQNLLPSDRTDIDVWGMEFDPTGVYEFYLTMADSDRNNDDWTVIYQLKPDLSWSELTTKVRTSVRSYRDMCFSSGGSFGEILYVADRVSETIMSVDPSGAHTVFASGFNGVESVTVSEDSEHMFVSDANGIYRIRATTTTVGPMIVMREPWVENDDVHTGESGVDSLRLLWDDRIIFGNADVNVVNEDANDVTFSVTGSNSEFMIITFGETLLYDRYTITINDSVVSAISGAAIDGDNDGTAGGDAVLVMEHRQRTDSDNDNDLDMFDFAEFADNWLERCR